MREVSLNSKESKWCSYLNVESKVELPRAAVKSQTRPDTSNFIAPRHPPKNGVTWSNSRLVRGNNANTYCTNMSVFSRSHGAWNAPRLPHDTTQAKSQSLWSLLEALHAVWRQKGRKTRRRRECKSVDSDVKKIFRSPLQMGKQGKLVIHQIREN